MQYVLFFIGCVLVVDALVGDKGVLQMVKKRQEFRALELDLAKSRAHNEQLRELAYRLQHDPAAIEDLARRDLGLIKPGEKVFIIRDAAPGAPNPGEK